MKDQKDDHRKDITLFVPGLLIHVTLHNPHCITKGRDYLPTFRVEKMTAFSGSHNQEAMDLGLQQLLFFGVSEKAYLHILYLNFMSAPKEKFNSSLTVSEKVSKRS